MMKLLMLGMVAAVSAVELNPDTWLTATAGKTVFVKFFAPWCGHCKSMKPDWDRLMGDFAEHPTIMVADVDCIGEGASICEEQGVEGFPTIKYGDVNDLEDYEGGRSFEELSRFASELKPACNPFNVELCDEEGKAAIEAMQALSDEELDAVVSKGTAAIAAAEELFETELGKLQAAYEKLSKEQSESIAAAKASGMRLAQAVIAQRAAPAVAKEEL